MSKNKMDTCVCWEYFFFIEHKFCLQTLLRSYHFGVRMNNDRFIFMRREGLDNISLLSYISRALFCSIWLQFHEIDIQEGWGE